MKKPKLPDLDETASFYEENTQRPRLRSAGLDHFPSRPRTGLRIVIAVLAFAALLVILALMGCSSHLPR